MVTRVKICCIGNTDEAALTVNYGASALGLVSEMPSGPGVISDEEIARIAGTVPPAVSTFLLTVKQDSEEIVRQQQDCRVNTLQLVERLTAGTYARLREALPGIALVQVIHVAGPESIAEAQSVAREVDALLLDTGSHDLPTKTLGGTGRVHDWRLSEKIVASVEKPVFLAGGLTPTNVREAIDVVRPYGVDVCSGLRTSGRLDEGKLAAFMNEVAAN